MYAAGGIDTTNSLTHAVASMREYRGQVTGWIPEGLRLPSAVAEASAGPGGLFAGANASLNRAEENFGNAVDVDLNVNTCAGVRNEKVEANLLGFGGKVGTDGLEVNKSLGGVRLPWVAARMNMVGGWFRKKRGCLV